MADPEVIQMPERPPPVEAPAFLKLSAETGMRFSPNDIRELKAETGKKLSGLTGGDADEADQMQTMAWLRLRHDGVKVPWADCGDIGLEFDVETPDPTNAGPSTSSPGSAASGG